jgi:hypothetical protein
MARAELNFSELRIYPKNDKTISRRGIKQRFIICSLGTHVSSMTRGALSKLFAKKFGISAKSAYHYVWKELEESLIPSGIVCECGNLRPIRGSLILQIKGIPYYQLTNFGLLIASSLQELDKEKREELLRRYKQLKKSESNGND